jgi:hypothetical protein
MPPGRGNLRLPYGPERWAERLYVVAHDALSSGQGN